MSGNLIITALFWSAEAVFALTTVVLCIAEFFLHRPVTLPVPSVYWPVAKCGSHPNRNVRRVFRFLFCHLFRKRFWNPVLNSSLKQKGFDRQRHLSTTNIHAACSAMTLALMVLFVYSGMPVLALLAAGFELVFNTPAIVLSRYLYLHVQRRPDLGRPKNPAKNGQEQMA